jgi:TusA-related sulfurtransferase
MSDQRLIIHQDQNLLLLKMEMEDLELNQISLFSEKADLEKMLGEFHYRHSIELGSILLEILKIKMTNLKSKQEFNQAQNEYNSYHKVFEEDKKIPKNQLNEVESKELKTKYRKASQLCHPDKVSEELRDRAGNIFNELKKAYIMNDLKRVNEILLNLETGNPFEIVSENRSKISDIQSIISKLKREISKLEQEIDEIKKSESYRTIAAIDNWDNYFFNTKKFLQLELYNLTKK